MRISKPVMAAVASPRPEDAIADLEATPAWSGDFKWSEAGMPQDATPKEAVEFKVRHVDETLERLAEMEQSLSKK